MPASKGWVEKLEAHYKEDALTLVPRLLNFYGAMQPLADEAGISLSRLSRWCDENGIEGYKAYRRRENVAQPS